MAAETTLAAQVLGFVDVDGVGQYGIEAGEDALLAGAAGVVSAQEDVIGRQIADSGTLLREPIDGADLRLTIDAAIQDLLEQEMWATYRERCARRHRPDHGRRDRRDPGDGELSLLRRERFATTDGELFATRRSRASTSPAL